MQINVYNQNGETTGKANLPADIFGVGIKPEVVHQVAQAMLANLRHPWAHTKTRGNVRGGGKKPWKQKHTGRARAGSNRSPIWIGGGITFGPLKERNYTQKINKKMKTKATLMCLSSKAEENKLVVLDEIKLPEAKTKYFSAMLGKLPLENKILFILAEKNEPIKRSSRNIAGVNVKTVGNFNVLDLLNAKSLVVTKECIGKLKEKYQK